jgi:hypothetical protein
MSALRKVSTLVSAVVVVIVSACSIATAAEWRWKEQPIHHHGYLDLRTKIGRHHEYVQRHAERKLYLENVLYIWPGHRDRKRHWSRSEQMQ